MNKLALILSFYLLVLNAYPCIDAPLDISVQNTELSSHAGNSHHNTSDQCSPFCTCNCCVTPFISQTYTILIDCYPFQMEQYSAIISPSFSSSFESIWQPPKLV